MPRGRRERRLAQELNDPKKIRKEQQKRDAEKARRKGNGKPPEK